MGLHQQAHILTDVTDSLSMPDRVGDLLATIYKALGIHWHKEYSNPVGRPEKIANSIDGQTGVPIDELI